MTSGILRKLQGQLETPVAYTLPIGDQLIPLTPYVGQNITLKFRGQIYCLECERLIKKTFNQGYCFPCSQKLARCDLCLVKPELCHFHLGTCREPLWGEANCFIPHYVYLANTSALKVGITRETHVPGRFIDQGASQALPVLKVPSRRQVGLIEVELAKHFPDKTHWRTMLKGVGEPQNLMEARAQLWGLCEAFRSEQIEYVKADVIEIDYPVLTYPTKITSLSFDKTPEISGQLMGIKGQYLILASGVLNIRKFSGYYVESEII